MWFRVDDKLPTHRKARKLRRGHPTKRRDSTPFGLWVLAGAFSDDGFVPLEVLEEWDDDAEELADRLTAAGFWSPAERDGERGYLFHDWADRNPADASQSGVFGNHMRWHVGANKPKAGCSLCESEGLVPISGATRPDHRPDIAPIIAPDSLPSRPDPTRPDPSTEDQRSPAGADEHEFEAWWKVYPRKVGKGQARRAYKSASKKTDHAALLDAVEMFASRAQHADPQFVPHPATWLNGERWLDAPDLDPGYRIEEDWS